jgi:hypothetical protein
VDASNPLAEQVSTAPVLRISAAAATRSTLEQVAQADPGGPCRLDEGARGIYLYAVRGVHERCVTWFYLATSIGEAIELWRGDESRQHEPNPDDQPGSVERWDVLVSGAAQKLLVEMLLPCLVET